MKYVRNVYSLFLAVQMSYQKARSRGGSKASHVPRSSLVDATGLLSQMDFERRLKRIFYLGSHFISNEVFDGL